MIISAAWKLRVMVVAVHVEELDRLCHQFSDGFMFTEAVPRPEHDVRLR
jgi:hypothetical protein